MSSDFSVGSVFSTFVEPKMKGEKNPYIKELKTQVTIRLDRDTVQYFKMLAKNTGMSYQNLINLYLRDCVETKEEPSIQWSQPAELNHP